MVWEFFPFLSPSFWWWPTILGISWREETSLQSHLYLHMGSFPVWVSVSVPKFHSSHKDTTYWIGAHANPVWPRLNLIISAKTLFTQVKSQPQVWWIRIWTQFFGRWRKQTHSGDHKVQLSWGRKERDLKIVYGKGHQCWLHSPLKLETKTLHFSC